MTKNLEYPGFLFFNSSPESWIGGGRQFASSKTILVVQVESSTELLKFQVMWDWRRWVAICSKDLSWKLTIFAQGKHLFMFFCKLALYRTAICCFKIRMLSFLCSQRKHFFNLWFPTSDILEDIINIFQILIIKGSVFKGGVFKSIQLTKYILFILGFHLPSYHDCQVNKLLVTQVFLMFCFFPFPFFALKSCTIYKSLYWHSLQYLSYF